MGPKEAVRRRRVDAVKAQRKLRAIRIDSRYSFPTADIDRMLAEIEAGRSGRGTFRSS